MKARKSHEHLKQYQFKKGNSPHNLRKEGSAPPPSSKGPSVKPGSLGKAGVMYSSKKNC